MFALVKTAAMLVVAFVLNNVMNISIDIFCYFVHSWNKNGRKLLSASTDNNIAVWDVLSGEADKRIRFPSPVLKVQFQPRNE